MTVVQSETKNGKLVETGRETRTYDKNGNVSSVVYRARGKIIVRMDYTWKNGRLAKRVYSEPGKRREERVFTYKVDIGGRVIEQTMRNPAATNGEHYVTTSTWSPDGSHTDYTERHYAKEGPYSDSSASYDKNGRVESRCSSSGNCEMPEYDAHGVVTRTRQQMSDGEHAYLSQTNTYDANGRLTTIEMGRTSTTFTYDKNGNVVAETRSDGSETLYTYKRR